MFCFEMRGLARGGEGLGFCLRGGDLGMRDGNAMLEERGVEEKSEDLFE